LQRCCTSFTASKRCERTAGFGTRGRSGRPEVFRGDIAK
jgi:hypothetical protein